MKYRKLTRAHMHGIAQAGVGAAHRVPARIFRNLRRMGLVLGARLEVRVREGRRELWPGDVAVPPAGALLLQHAMQSGVRGARTQRRRAGGEE